MVRFLSEHVRTEFHLLPLSRQMEVTEAAERLAVEGLITVVLFVERETDGSSEISIRIDKEFDPVPGLERKPA